MGVSGWLVSLTNAPTSGAFVTGDIGLNVPVRVSFLSANIMADRSDRGFGRRALR